MDMQQVASPSAPPRRRIFKLSGHTRDKRGCLTCRQRKKKCDSAQGPCTACQRLNLQCMWEQERIVLPSESVDVIPYRSTPTSNSTLVRAPHPLQFWLEVTDSGASSAVLDRRLALRYYVQTFAGILSTNAENNGFLSGRSIHMLPDTDWWY